MTDTIEQPLVIPDEFYLPLMAFWDAGSSHENRTSSARQAGVDQETVDLMVEAGFLIAVPQTLGSTQYYMRRDVAVWANDQ